MPWANLVRLRVDGYGREGPGPGAAESAWELDLDAQGTDIDLTGLALDIEEVLRGEPYTLDVNYSHFSWGADGAALDLIVGVASGAAVLFLDRLLTYAHGKFAKQAHRVMDTDAAARDARRFVASARNVAEHEVVLEQMRADQDGYRLVAKVGERRFKVAWDTATGVRRMEPMP